MVLADDHPLFLEGVARVMDAWPNLEVVAAVEHGVAAVEAIADLRPDVAVLDLDMPGLDGIAVVRALRARGVDTPVLLLTGSGDAEALYLGLSAGAAGMQLKTASFETICDAIVALARGEARFAPELQAGLAAAIRARESTDRGPRLSEREQEVLRLTASGATAAGIGGLLHLSPATVRTHLQNLYQKLEVSDRAAAVAAGMRLGLID